MEAGHESREGDGGHLVDDGLLQVALDRLQHRRVGDGTESPEYEHGDIIDVRKAYPDYFTTCTFHA